MIDFIFNQNIINSLLWIFEKKTPGIDVLLVLLLVTQSFQGGAIGSFAFINAKLIKAKKWLYFSFLLYSCISFLLYSCAYFSHIENIFDRATLALIKNQALLYLIFLFLYEKLLIKKEKILSMNEILRSQKRYLCIFIIFTVFFIYAVFLSKSYGTSLHNYVALSVGILNVVWILIIEHYRIRRILLHISK